ncbi:hypothetical protein KIL84_004112 [Mauremys mutica]|uniref:Uncharacterized protein n=1 Tax=Mauremys mutica TaxID=74926 RepID=A0A9D3XP07_9SAUR|nr:hypothetical protein KIL84_004112 [Mauremys mutica]
MGKTKLSFAHKPWDKRVFSYIRCNVTSVMRSHYLDRALGEHNLLLTSELGHSRDSGPVEQLWQSGEETPSCSSQLCWLSDSPPNHIAGEMQAVSAACLGQDLGSSLYFTHTA